MSVRIVLLGPPGAGKGTQAARLCGQLAVPAISTGDIFRSGALGNTEAGRRAKAHMDKGEYVPDVITNALVEERLSRPDASQGFLLDGYPRTEAQVRELDAMLERSGASLDAVVEITLEDSTVVERLLKRAQDQGRADDTEPVIRHRLEVYAERTAPLAAIYATRGLLVRVDGNAEVDEVADRIVSALGARGLSV
ncbi:MAG: adenylate kinase [Actinomyces sp.]|uniref:adenylate kinase n=1 Tax=Actinomyces sp. TaxID=29317 RepID=UPI0026DC7361|nr:adenylate kinase [Actinomyces sp.]MDO4242533.1 adenylate kinase [Actinomyces sp.]